MLFTNNSTNMQVVLFIGYIMCNYFQIEAMGRTWLLLLFIAGAQGQEKGQAQGQEQGKVQGEEQGKGDEEVVEKLPKPFGTGIGPVYIGGRDTDAQVISALECWPFGQNKVELVF